MTGNKVRIVKIIDSKHIANWLRVAVARKEMKKAELGEKPTTNVSLADKLGVTPSMIRVYKEGRIYDIRQLQKIAWVFDTTLDELFEIVRAH